MSQTSWIVVTINQASRRVDEVSHHYYRDDAREVAHRLAVETEGYGRREQHVILEVDMDGYEVLVDGSEVTW